MTTLLVGEEERALQQMVEAAESISLRLRDQLAEVVGRDGVRAIAVRAVGLTRAEFPFLSVEPVFEQERFLKGLATSVQRRDPVEVVEAVSTMLANLLGLLFRLFGSALARRFIHDALPGIEIG